MNPMQIMQLMNQMKNSQNPMGMLQQTFGNNPAFQQALQMAQGKSPQQLQQTIMNLARTKGINPQELSEMAKMFGIKA